MTTTTLKKVNFVCPGCTAVNRVPENRLGDGRICARCKSALIPSHPVELDDSTFDRFISRSEVPVVVDFWASWCGPCRSMAPEFASAFSQLAPDVMLAKLNTESSEVASRYKIAGIPCLIAFKSGKEVGQQTGLMTADQIVKWSRLVTNS